MRYHAGESRYEKVKIAGTEAFFTDDRIQRDSVPEGLYQYEVRHDDDGLGEPVQIAKGILVNFWGTLLCTERLEEAESQRGMYLSEVDWRCMSDRSSTLDELLRKEG